MASPVHNRSVNRTVEEVLLILNPAQWKSKLSIGFIASIKH